MSLQLVDEKHRHQAKHGFCWFSTFEFDACPTAAGGPVSQRDLHHLHPGWCLGAPLGGPWGLFGAERGRKGCSGCYDMSGVN